MITGQQAAAISDLNPEVQWRHPRSVLISSMQELGRRYTQRTAAPESCKSQPVVSLRFEGSHLFLVKRLECMLELGGSLRWSF